MTDKLKISERLKLPFPKESVHWRIGARTRDKTKGIALAYIDARDVMDRLDSVVGPDGWEDEYTETQSGRVICTLHVRLNDRYTRKSDGAGDTGTEGEKGAISDAFKRAAVKFGIGRYLYSLPNNWVELKNDGRAFVKDPELPPSHLPRSRIDRELVQRSLFSFINGIEDADALRLKETADELEAQQLDATWKLLSNKQQMAIKSLLHESKK